MNRAAPTRLNASARAKPLSVLHVRVVCGSGGGPDKTILRSAKALNTSRYRVAAAYLHPPADPGIERLKEIASQHDCPFFALPDHGPADPRVVTRLLEVCRSQDVKLWHAHDYKSEVLGLLLRQRHPMKLVTTLHGFTGETWRTRLYAKVADHAIRRYDHALAVSPELVEHARRLGLTSEQVTPLPNAIEAHEYASSPSRSAARAQLKIDPAASVIGVIARLSIEKGIDRAIDLLPALRKLNPKAQLHVIGSGPQEATLQRQAQSVGVADQVVWHGWQTDVRPYLASMNALLLPSRTEGLPNVLLEAMVMRVPVAATPVGGVPELLDHGKCGRLLGRHVEDWPWAVASLLRPGSHLAALTDAAHRRVTRHHSFAARMQRVAEVYDRLTQASKPAHYRAA